MTLASLGFTPILTFPRSSGEGPFTLTLALSLKGEGTAGPVSLSVC